MTTDSTASNPGGICDGCGKSSGAELMPSSSGDMLCPDCCDDEEGGQETIAFDQLANGVLSTSCQSCGALNPDLLTTADGLKLCSECYWQQESQRTTLVSTTPDEGPESTDDFDAATLAEIPPIRPQTGGPGTCEECGKGTLKRLPVSDGRLLCERCVWEVEQSQSTLAMNDVDGADADSVTGTCEGCEKADTSLLEVADGRRLCADCYIEQQ